MKLSITQSIFGILIILTACYIVGWMIFGANELLNMPVPDEKNVMVHVGVTPVNENLFNYARYGSGLLLLLGITLLAVSIFQTARAGRYRNGPAITQLIIGVLVAGASVFITGWGYPLQFTLPGQEVNTVFQLINVNPGPTQVFATFLTMLSAVFGIAVIVMSIVQLVKSRQAADT